MRPADLQKEKYHSMLTHSQRIGYKYMEHFKKSVTPEEAETVAVGSKLWNPQGILVHTSFRNLYATISRRNTKLF